MPSTKSLASVTIAGLGGGIVFGMMVAMMGMLRWSPAWSGHNHRW